MRAIGWLLVLVISGAAALTLDLEWAVNLHRDWTGWTMVAPVSQVVAMRSLVAIGFIVLAVITLVVGIVRKVGFRGGTRTLVLGLALALVGVGHAWVLTERGLDNPGRLTVDGGVRPGDRGTGEITVLTLNTLGGRTGVEDVAELAGPNGADVVVLPETSRATAEELATALAASGATFQVFDAAGAEDEPAGSTAMLVSAALGEYVQTPGPATRFGAVRAEPATGVGPVLVGVHPAPPSGDLHDVWQEDLAAVTALCAPRTTRGLILAGDLNATLDHAPLRDVGRCVHGAAGAGVGGVATWPTRTPEWLGAAIDHVIADGEAYEPTQAAVVEVGGSDHRALLVRLRPVGTDQ